MVPKFKKWRLADGAKEAEIEGNILNDALDAATTVDSRDLAVKRVKVLEKQLATVKKQLKLCVTDWKRKLPMKKKRSSLRIPSLRIRHHHQPLTNRIIFLI